MAGKIDVEVAKIIDAGYKNAQKILVDLRSKLDVLADELLKQETLDADDFATLVGPKALPVKAKAK